VKRFLKILALLMLIAGLSLQNVHAVAMPVCNQDQQTAAAHPQSAQAGDTAEHDHADHQHTSTAADKACDGCGLCQVCSAPAVASVAIDVLLDFVQTPPPALISHPSLFVPEQLQRPPRAVLA
jgi:hypothetical protein